MATPIVVWLASYPRAGVTFVRHVIQELYGIPTYTVYPGEAKVTGITAQDNYWPRDADPGLPVHFVKVHEAELASRAGPAIHIVRDGRDTLVSYAHYRRDYAHDVEPIETILNKLVAGDLVFPHWGLHTLAWSSRKVPRIRFKDVIANPKVAVQVAVAMLDLPLQLRTDAEIQNFHALHQTRPQFFRAGTTDQWRMSMSPAQQEMFWERHGLAQHWFETNFNIHEDEHDRGRSQRTGTGHDTGSVRRMAEWQGEECL